MNQDQLTSINVMLGSLAIIGLYSVLWKENVVYRTVEHIFLGLAAGYSVVALWKETLYVQWWIPMTGKLTEEGKFDTPGYWPFMLLFPIGLMAYTVFNKEKSWMSRIPIGIILGLWSGQQIQIYWNKFGPMIEASMVPLIPTATDSFFAVPTTQLIEGKIVQKPEAAQLLANLYPTEAINNLIFLVTLLSALAYFLFSVDIKGKAMLGFNKLGRWMLMIGFGAIFGSTVMARFALVIDRLAYIWQDWLRLGV
ncbi:MAG TPA: hypothetical protein PLB31_01360 [Fimbriimonadaceae bacterium]|nr:hypothetical protein [Armatimonadota bacterium]HCM74102.1 hypothetical protein [Armatimonadota bacterium]HRD31551.1 hypothetical protein [Fimbriimonadaceae bacterium]HRE93283.1 hypothetical protein [Fimbriimonadaceae bacterium]HRI73100.1 hypothetical protein [Fimbriimonadaceae bacterium]